MLEANEGRMYHQLLTLIQKCYPVDPKNSHGNQVNLSKKQQLDYNG